MSGRIPLFFVADGIYALRLTDQYGIQSNGGFFYPQIPSIGASSSGGGGSAVDPTTVFSTGDWKWRPSTEILAGWVRLNGRTIGNASSGASERASADTQALFLYAWGYPDAKCPVLGGRGANALADFNANKQITLLDMRGRGPMGLDDMGNAAAGRITTANMPGSTDTPTTAAGYGGASTNTLVTANLPAYTPSGSITNGAINIPVSTFPSSLTSPTLQGYATGNGLAGGIPNSQAPSSFTGAAQGGTSTAFNNCQPFVLGTAYWKL